MTCAHCETSVATALKDAGARDVKVDHRRAEATFLAPEAIDLATYQAAVSRAGYGAGSAVVSEGAASPPQAESRPVSAHHDGWLGTAALVALPALCCGLPLLAAALVASGAGAWLATHGSLLAIPAVVLALALLVWRRARRTL